MGKEPIKRRPRYKVRYRQCAEALEAGILFKCWWVKDRSTGTVEHYTSLGAACRAIERSEASSAPSGERSHADACRAIELREATCV